MQTEFKKKLNCRSPQSYYRELWLSLFNECGHKKIKDAYMRRTPPTESSAVVKIKTVSYSFTNLHKSKKWWNSWQTAANILVACLQWINLSHPILHSSPQCAQCFRHSAHCALQYLNGMPSNSRMLSCRTRVQLESLSSSITSSAISARFACVFSRGGGTGLASSAS